MRSLESKEGRVESKLYIPRPIKTHMNHRSVRNKKLTNLKLRKLTSLAFKYTFSDKNRLKHTKSIMYA